MRITTLAAAAVLAIAAGCAQMGMGGSAATPARAADGRLVGPNGMTLYTFDRDAAGGGKSACNGTCAQNWPPLGAGADARPVGDWSVVTRDDGARQWAYKGRPVYYWVKDQKPGDASGDNVGGVWRVARP